MIPSAETSLYKLHLAVISHLFPNEFSPVIGKFIKDHLDLLHKEDWIHPTLIVPTPYSIPLTKRNRKNNSPLLLKDHFAQRIKYLSFPRKTFPKLAVNSLSKNLKKYFTANSFDGAHFHWLYPDGLGIPAVHDLGMKTILTIHGSDWYKNHANKTLKPLIEDTFEKADRILLVGPELLQDIKSVFPQYEGKLFEIGNYINQDIYTIPTTDQISKARTSLNWSVEKKHFLTAANFRKEKGIDILMDAVNSIPKSYSKSIEFHLVGTSDSESIQMQNIPDYVSFHPPVPPEHLIKFYHASDAYISPSRKEGFGLAIIEAAACGLPVIATTTGIAPTFIDETIGLLCPTNNSQELSNSITELFIKIDKYSSQEIRDKAVRMFGKETYRDKLLPHYRECFTS